MSMVEASDRWHGPTPRDPDFGECQVEYQQMGNGVWKNCGEDADEEVMDTLMCPEHMNDHYRSEQADRDRKRAKEE